MPSALTATARCHACGELERGDPAKADKSAEKHTAVGHATATEIRWAK